MKGELDEASLPASLPQPEPVAMAPPDGILLVLTTVGSREEAGEIAQALVEERLAACVNVVADCSSTYRWQGAVEQADETMLLIKTTRNRYRDLGRVHTTAQGQP